MRRSTIPDTIHNLSGRGVPHVGLQPDRREIPSLQSVRTRKSCTTIGKPSSSSDSMSSLEAILRSAVATRPLMILHSSDDRGKSSSSTNADALISLKATDTRRPMLSQGVGQASASGPARRQLLVIVIAGKLQGLGLVEVGRRAAPRTTRRLRVPRPLTPWAQMLAGGRLWTGARR